MNTITIMNEYNYNYNYDQLWKSCSRNKAKLANLCIECASEMEQSYRKLTNLCIETECASEMEQSYRKLTNQTECASEMEN